MKKIDIEAFGLGQQIWFNISRLRRAEEILKKPMGVILKESDNLALGNLIVLLQVGMSHIGTKPASYFEQKIDEAMENGYSVVDIQNCVLKAIAGSGLMGKEFYYQMFPEERLAESAVAEKNE